ncbi:MAG: porphobilinogen synthase [Bacillota bacterium]
MPFPIQRLRRLRQNNRLRNLVRETVLTVDDLIYPFFVVPGTGFKKEIPSLPGNYHLSVDRLPEEIAQVQELGINAVLLFGLPESKDEIGSGAYQENGVVQRAIRMIKEVCPGLVVIPDLCLCEYTSHGHCGILKGTEVDNDSTLKVLQKVALSYAQAGADLIAPSDMMDGRVGAIREVLDQNGYFNIPILSYSAKYASAFYGPFREAADSAPKFGDRSSYQMDPANGVEALREIAADLEEGADLVMVKPALAYLDIISRAKESFNIPVIAYNVSGEYAMVKAAAANGWIDGKRITLEILRSIKRAGADAIITYHAVEAARWLQQEGKRYV